MAKRETISEKKIRILKEFEEFFKEQAEKETNDEEYIIADDTVPKNTMVLTNASGEVLHVMLKFDEKNKLFLTDVYVPRKKRAKKNGQ